MSQLTPAEPPDAPPSLRWPDARRVEAFAGEARVNRIRLIAILVFYARHLLDAHLNPTTTGGTYHTRATAIIAAWIAGAIVVHVLLVRRRAVPSLAYATVAMDLLAITLLGVASGGPKTPLAILYFVVIASSSLRLSLGVVWLATLGSWAGYGGLLMYYAWYLIGWDKYYATPDLRIPRSEEAIRMLAMGAAGLMAGQAVRQARRLVAGYPVAVVETART